MMQLSAKDLVVVTGAYGYLGRCWVHHLASEGCKVVAHGRDVVKLQQLDDEIQGLGFEPLILADFDALDFKAAQKLAQTIAKLEYNYKGLIWCVGAATACTSSIDITLKEVTQSISVNYLAPLNAVQAFHDLASSAKPGFVYAFDDSYVVGEPFFSPYADSKRALASFLCIYAKEHAHLNIFVANFATNPLPSKLRKYNFPGENQSNLASAKQYIIKIKKFLSGLSDHEIAKINGSLIKVT